MESNKKNQSTSDPISSDDVKAPTKLKNGPIIYRKVFEPRESLLTIMISSNSHIRSLYNMIIAFVVIFTISTIGDYLSNHNKFKSDYAIFQWSIRDFYPHFIMVWFTMNAILFLVHYPLVLYRHLTQCQQLLRSIQITQHFNQNDQKKKPSKLKEIHQQMNLDKLYTEAAENGITLNGWKSGLIAVVYCVELTAMIAYCVWYIVHHNVNVAISFALTMELCRLIMKSHSYFVEKMWLSVSKPELEKIVDSIQNSKSDLNANNLVSRPKLSSFVYFLFAPTLIYRDSYPRNERINWNVVAWNGIQLVMVVLIWFVLVLRFLIDNLSTTGDEPFNVAHFSQNLSNLYLFGVIVFFLIFYGFLQLWHNLTAELLRFADRHYYDAWWQSISLGEFYRKWNQLVQEWLFTYIYVPVYNYTRNRSFAAYSVIFISGVWHELIIGLSIKFFFPILFFAFSIGGHLWYLLSKNMRRNSSRQLHNAVFMALYALGWGIISAIYTVEWYSRTNCPLTQNSTLMDSMIPRLVSCVKIE